MFSKIKDLLKDYFVVEYPGDDYVFYPNEYGSYPFYKLSDMNDDSAIDDINKNTLE
jgi:hypothetical protein